MPSETRSSRPRAVTLPLIVLLRLAGLLAVLPVLRSQPAPEIGSPAPPEIHSEHGVDVPVSDGPGSDDING